ALTTAYVGALSRCVAKPCSLKNFPRHISRELHGAHIASRLSGSDIPTHAQHRCLTTIGSSCQQPSEPPSLPADRPSGRAAHVARGWSRRRAIKEDRHET